MYDILVISVIIKLNSVVITRDTYGLQILIRVLYGQPVHT